MTDNKTQLATFRVEPELWEAFKMQSRKQGRTASDVLNEFVQNYVDSTIASTEIPQLDNLDELIEEKLTTRLAPIVERLVAIEQRKRVKRPYPPEVQESQSLGEYALQG